MAIALAILGYLKQKPGPFIQRLSNRPSSPGSGKGSPFAAIT